MTQIELARAAGVGEWVVVKIETRRLDPSEEILGRLADALGVAPEELDGDFDFGPPTLRAA
jgi:transcriptional regulator with XRE-family HTH domain